MGFERDRAFYGQHEGTHKLLPWESLLPLRESLSPWLVARKILCVLCARLLQNENCYSTESEAAPEPEPEQAAKHSRRVEW